MMTSGINAQLRNKRGIKVEVLLSGVQLHTSPIARGYRKFLGHAQRNNNTISSVCVCNLG